MVNQYKKILVFLTLFCTQSIVSKVVTEITFPASFLMYIPKSLSVGGYKVFSQDENGDSSDTIFFQYPEKSVYGSTYQRKYPNNFIYPSDLFGLVSHVRSSDVYYVYPSNSSRKMVVSAFDRGYENKKTFRSSLVSYYLERYKYRGIKRVEGLYGLQKKYSKKVSFNDASIKPIASTIPLSYYFPNGVTYIPFHGVSIGDNPMKNVDPDYLNFGPNVMTKPIPNEFMPWSYSYFPKNYTLSNKL